NDASAADSRNKTEGGRRERSADFPVRSNLGTLHGFGKFCDSRFVSRCCGLESPRSSLESAAVQCAIRRRWQVWGILPIFIFASSLARRYRRRFFSGLRRVEEEFERVGVLILLHQLEIDTPRGLGDGVALLE